MLIIKKVILILLCLLIISLFLIGCQKEITDEELESELEKLSEEELDEIIEQGEIEDPSLFGEASFGDKSMAVGKYKSIEVQKILRIAKKVRFSYYPKFSARVYKIDPILTPTPEIVILKNLDESGYLRGDYITVL